MHSFFIDDIAPAGETLTLAKRESDHLFKTLRARKDDLVELLDGRGSRAEAVVCADRSLRICSVEHTPEPAGKLRLYCAPPRKAKFDVLLKQAAELGVWEIQLVKFERNVSQPEGSDRWQILLQEGCKQSKNPYLPQVHPPVEAAEMLRMIGERRESAWFGAIRTASNAPEHVSDYAWIVGPEGGFTPAEEEEMLKNGVKPLNLGPYVLRLETAAVCGLAVLRQMMTGAEI
ncbi:MAG: 16S rRNA (uracil(1498)-N(3))-methyltransferase [Lentisphaeria bacterium]|nr:16S rRNA (uracil(1498)-N(3))-methyltransferase [Lentisphaeria bacterium]